VLRAHPAGVTRALNTALDTALATPATGGSGCGRWGRERFPQPAPPEFPQLAPPEFPQLTSPIGTNGVYGREQFEKMVWGLGDAHNLESRDRTGTAISAPSRRDLGAISVQPPPKTEPERRRAQLDQKRKELVESRMSPHAPPWAPPHGPRPSAHAPPWGIPSASFPFRKL
jgi:hypothetical protein